MDLGLANKVAVITGGSVGIGLAIAEGLGAEGVNLVLAARGAERVQAEAKRLAGQFGVRAEGVACDVATGRCRDALAGTGLALPPWEPSSVDFDIAHDGSQLAVTVDLAPEPGMLNQRDIALD